MSLPVIEFMGFEIINLEMQNLYEEKHSKEFDEEKNESSHTIVFGVTEDLTEAVIKLDVVVYDRNNNKKVNLIIEGVFKVNDGKSREDVDKHLHTNGVNILYPYARTIVSVIVSLDSAEAPLLPTVNLANFTKE